MINRVEFHIRVSALLDAQRNKAKADAEFDKAIDAVYEAIDQLCPLEKKV